jgi:hypothetical protein
MELDLMDIKQLYSQGQSLNKLGKKYNCKPDTIANLLRSNGVYIRTREEQRVFTYGIKPVEEWWEQYRKGESTYAIAEKNRVSQDVVRYALVDAGYKLRKGNQRHNLPWAEIEAAYLDQNVLPSMAQLARKYGCEKTLIRTHFKKHGVPIRDVQEQCKIDRIKGRRRYCDVNEDFFNEWSPDMAYVLGWIYADGSIKKNLQGFQITSSDLDHLANIGNMLGSDLHVSLYKGKRNKQVAGKLCIYRPAMVERLVEIGLTPAKSKTMEFPTTIPENFLGSFIRGYFEGDGYVGDNHRGRKNPGIRISFASSSKTFLEELSRILDKTIGVTGKMYINKTTQVWTLYVLNAEMVRKMFSFMYDGTYPQNRLYRKWKVFVNYFNPNEGR